MIDIKRAEDCCGCGACAQVCPKSCISMTADNEGFLYPHVNTSDCVQCGLCEKACNISHRREERAPLKVLAAINRDEKIRKQSSSGGIFHILAENVINKGGIVFGARFDENWQVVLDYADTLDGIKPFMGSKYVQATIGDSYKTAKKFLEEGRQVMFTGTPCQIAGLHQYLRKSYPNLLTVDFVCHGVPSPKVWGKYLEQLKADIRKKGDDSVYVPFRKSHYMRAFLADIILRPSCYECKSKGGRSNSDITLADFWGISSIFPEMDDDKGTSMVFVNTDKGASALDLATFSYKEAAYEQIKPLNPSCYRSASRPANRQMFFDSLDSTDDLNTLVDRYTRWTFRKRLKNICRVLLRKIQRSKTTSDSNIKSISFRDKSEGWSSYGLSIKLERKMKIGILTQPLRTNYGGLLQNYALQQILIRAGFEAETIDWDEPEGFRQSLYRIKIRARHALFPGRWPEPIYRPSADEIAAIRRNTSYFVNKYIRHTEALTSGNMFAKQAKRGGYEAYVVGSDQCWRPCYNYYLPAMFLDFARDKKVRRIAYAASFGTDKWEFSPQQTDICALLAKKFDLITVREDSGAGLCKRYLGADATHVLDPTMLLAKEDYIRLCEAENEPRAEGTLFHYILDPDDRKTSFVGKVAAETGLKAFQVMPKRFIGNHTREDMKCRIGDFVFPRVTAWLRAFMDAEMTIVDSFHGAVFSIIFNKPFWVIGNEKRGMARFTSLLKMFHLEDRLIDESELGNLDFHKAIDWNEVNSILEEKRRASKELLLENLHD